MRAAALVLVIVLVMAGCVADPAPGTPKSARGQRDTPVSSGPAARLEPPTAVVFANPVTLGTVGSGAEPSIAAAPDGTVYVTTPLALWRSDDGGKSYKPIGNPACPQNIPTCPGLETYRPGMRGGGDADLHVAPDGRVHWLGLFDGQNAIPYQVSEDKGEKWSAVEDLAGEDSADREWITGRADGTLFASWRNFPAPGSGRQATIVSRVSYDGGKSWAPATDVAKDTRMGGIAVDPSSNALALAHDSVSGEVQVAHSFDNGSTWESVLVVDDPTQGQVFPVLAFDTNGTLYLVFAHDREGLPYVRGQVTNRPLESPKVYLAVSHDKGLTWTKPIQVNPAGTTAWFPWIAAGLDGRIVVTWYQNDKGLPRQLTDEVYPMAGISVDADLASPHFKVARMSPQPIHRGPECRENPGVCNRSFLDFFEVAITPAGYPVATWATDTWPVPRVSVQASYMSEGPDLLH